MDKKSVLIVAGPGEVREGIKALLEAIPDIGLVETFSPLALAEADIKKLFPELIILDPTHEDVDCRKMLSQFRQQLPCIKVLAIVDKEEEKEECRSEGVDATLVKGFRGQSFVSAVGNLLEKDRERCLEDSQGDRG